MSWKPAKQGEGSNLAAEAMNPKLLVHESERDGNDLGRDRAAGSVVVT